MRTAPATHRAAAASHRARGDPQHRINLLVQKQRAGDRAAEWGQSLNTQAIVLSDRLSAGTAGDPTSYESIHTSEAGDWKGSVLWNDNHVAFEQSSVLETRYGSGELNVDGDGDPADDIFADDGATANSDALMIIGGTGTTSSITFYFN